MYMTFFHRFVLIFLFLGHANPQKSEESCQGVRGDSLGMGQVHSDSTKGLV